MKMICFQTDAKLLEIQVKLCQLIYRYLAKDDVSQKVFDEEDTKESHSSLMHLSNGLTGLTADQKTRLLIGLIDDIHDSADIMQNRSLSN